GTSPYIFPIARGCSSSTSGDPGGAPKTCSPTSTSGSPPIPSGSPRRSKSTPPPGGRSNTVPVAIITGAGGLIGSEAVDHFIGQGFDVVGIENDLRPRFFGPESSPSHVTQRLVDEHDSFKWENVDIRDAAEIERIFREHAGSIELVIHTAAQPSHDWAASEPQTDFGVNANGTLNLLEAARAHAIDAPFIFTSTNKVYGDTPNRLPLRSLEKRLELPEEHPYYKGNDTPMSIDLSPPPLFGVSKAAADLLVQE